MREDVTSNGDPLSCRGVEADDSSTPSDADLADLDALKRKWVESIRPLIARMPESQRARFRIEFLEIMGGAGWEPAEAAGIVSELFP